MAQGFIVNEAEVAGITTTIAAAAVITLGAFTTVDANATAIPAGGYMSHVEVQATKTAGTPATLTAVLTYDVAGDDPASVATAVPLVASATTANTYVAKIPLDQWNRTPAVPGALPPPAGYTYGRLYLFLVTNAGTITLNKARLQWRDGHSGG